MPPLRSKDDRQYEYPPYAAILSVGMPAHTRRSPVEGQIFIAILEDDERRQGGMAWLLAGTEAWLPTVTTKIKQGPYPP